MKKTFFILLIVGFLVFAFLGFKAALRINQQSPDFPTQTVTDQLAGNQKNYLVVHVDDLASNKPQLITAWGSLIAFSTPLQVMFVPLYPNPEENLTDRLTSDFSIQPTGRLEDRSVSSFENEYDLQIDGYILIDTKGIALFQKWADLQQDEAAIRGESGIDQDEIASEKKFLNALCQTFKKDGAKSYLNKIRWTELLPQHFSTNLSFETFTLALDLLKTSGKLQSCEIIATN